MARACLPVYRGTHPPQEFRRGHRDGCREGFAPSAGRLRAHLHRDQGQTGRSLRARPGGAPPRALTSGGRHPRQPPLRNVIAEQEEVFVGNPPRSTRISPRRAAWAGDVFLLGKHLLAHTRRVGVGRVPRRRGRQRGNPRRCRFWLGLRHRPARRRCPRRCPELRAGVPDPHGWTDPPAAGRGSWRSSLVGRRRGRAQIVGLTNPRRPFARSWGSCRTVETH